MSDDPTEQMLARWKAELERLPDGDERRLHLALHALAAVRLWANIHADWALEELEAQRPRPGDDDEAQARRVALQWYMEMPETPLPPQQREDTWCMVPLPAAIRRDLSDALDALNEGELRPLFQPVSGAGRRQAWTEWQHRFRACQHVQFLIGRGVSEAKAVQRVASAYGCNDSPDTVRKWRQRIIERDSTARERLDEARRAGELHTRLEDDPEFGRRDGEAIDANELHTRNELASERLADVGRAFNGGDRT